MPSIYFVCIILNYYEILFINFTYAIYYLLHVLIVSFIISYINLYMWNVHAFAATGSER
jgi:hypothetical protein